MESFPKFKVRIKKKTKVIDLLYSYPRGGSFSSNID